MTYLKTTIIALSLFASVTACSVPGELADWKKNKTTVCIDMRDGSRFTFNNKTIKDVRIGIGAPSSFQVTTTDGSEMTLNSTMEAYLKCTEVK